MQYNKTQEVGIIPIGEINTAFAERFMKQPLKETVEYRVNVTAFGHMTATWSVMY